MRHLCLWALLAGVVSRGALAAADPPPPPPLPRQIPVPMAPVSTRAPLPKSLTRAVPRSVKELLEIQQRVRSLVGDLSRATVGLRVGRGAGSGVIISKDGYVLSAAHVTGAPNRNVTVFLPDGRVVRGKTLGHNRGLDASLLKINGEGPWPFCKIARPQDVRVGDWCLALGHPGGFQRNRPPVVRLGRVVRMQSQFVQTDCTLVGGDSGGPLFDLAGNVIGIHSRIGAPTSWNFHVPVIAFTASWRRLLAGESFGQQSQRKAPVLGINGVDDEKGCKVTGVAPNLPAAKAGVKEGDIIVRCDGKRIEGFGALFDLVHEKKPGQKIRLSIRRLEKPLEIVVTLAGG